LLVTVEGYFMFGYSLWGEDAPRLTFRLRAVSGQAIEK